MANPKSVHIIDGGLVDKILEQGQRLRNAMVESILKNDPLNSEILFDQHYNTPTSSINLCNIHNIITDYPKADERNVEAFLKGDHMSKNDELLALDTLRSMSASDLCKTTNKAYSSYQVKCNCSTCKAYDANDLKCDLRRSNYNRNTSEQNTDENYSNIITKQIQEQYRNENIEYLKYVDSLKISVHSLVLNEAGNRKVNSQLSEGKNQVPLNQTYFLEYCVPDFLNKNTSKGKSKVDSGLEVSNTVRICSRRRFNEAITFRQTSIHDVSALNTVNLKNVDIKFRINYRNSKQKNASVLGYAHFSFNSFETSKDLTCNRGLTVKLNENAPIDLGILKVSLQLGCGRLYFGKEFLDAINVNKESPVVLDSDDSACQSNVDIPLNTITVEDKPEDEKPSKEQPNLPLKSPNKPEKSRATFKSKDLGGVKSSTSNLEDHTKSILKKSPNTTYFSDENVPKKPVNKLINEERQILFGFVYISEAQYLSPPVNSYVTCRPFCQDNSYSRLITNSSNPVFNFCQIVPLVFDDDVLLQFRENYMLIEFWKKSAHKDEVIGLAKIPLHQFYLAYRNQVIIKYLEKNKLPIIGTDWWEPILTPTDEEALGQVQVLLALGTEEQIKNLELERGFKNNIVKAKFWSPSKENVVELDNISKFKSKSVRIGNPNRPVLINKNYTIPTKDQGTTAEKSIEQESLNKIKKVNVGTQSDLKMDSNKEQNKPSPTKELLGTFLNQLMAQKPKTILVENGTNTEMVNSTENITVEQVDSNVDMKKTTDLLDSLEKALSVNVNQQITARPHQSTTFKAHIVIDSALHLPSRKKCKSRKSKNKAGKSDDNILPTTYVTFETAPQGEMKFTEIISKNTRPKWDFQCDVNLPADLLTNNQNRLIFKVWRKSTSTVKQPNLQADIVLGFAALDLTVLLAGLPNVQGWFNIVDFAGKCNGQINIHVNPLEDVMRFYGQKEVCSNSPTTSPTNINENHETDMDEPGELLSRALKRKFTELDEITQRLRLRLSKVTNDESDNSNDEIADEFEHDINTLCIEEDFNLINFADETTQINTKSNNDNKNVNYGENLALSLTSDGGSSKEDSEISGSCASLMEIVDSRKSSNTNFESVSEATTLGTPQTLSAETNVTALDRNLFKGKQRIDTLLEKLSLMSAEANNPFTNRYVSGCSTSNENSNVDTEAILQQLDHSSRPNIQSGSNFDAVMFQQIYNASSSNSRSNSQTYNSETSIISNFSDCRPAPDGQGNPPDDKVLKKSDELN